MLVPLYPIFGSLVKTNKPFVFMRLGIVYLFATYLPGNSDDIVKRKLSMTGGETISCEDNITCEPLLT